MLLGSALNPINSSMIATALVPIATDLHIAVGRTAVLVSVLYLASAVTQPAAGRLAEVLGPRRVFVGGTLVVLAGGILAGFAHGLDPLLAARLLIGIGTSCAYPTAIVLIQRRAKQFGMTQPPGGVLGGLQIAGTVSASLALPLGGVLVDISGWRSVFLINVPLTVLAVVAAMAWIPHDPPRHSSETTRTALSRVDLTGMVGFSVTMAMLLEFLSSAAKPNWFALVGSIVIGSVFIAWESRAKQPFIDIWALVHNAALTRTYLRYALVALCVYAVLYSVAQWLQTERALSALGTGLLLLPMSVISGAVVAPISRHNLVRGPILIAAAATLAGSICLLFVTARTPTMAIAAVLVIFGIALGAAASGNQLALYLQAEPEQLGVASGLFRTFRLLRFDRRRRAHRHRVSYPCLRSWHAPHRHGDGYRQRCSSGAFGVRPQTPQTPVKPHLGATTAVPPAATLKKGKTMRLLRIALVIIGVTQISYGAILFVNPSLLARMLGATDSLPVWVKYILITAGARFIGYGVGMFAAAYQPARRRLWIATMILIQLVDLIATLIYCADNQLSVHRVGMTILLPAVWVAVLATTLWRGWRVAVTESTRS